METPYALDVVLPSPAHSEDLLPLERVNPDGDNCKIISRFAPGILVKFGWNHDEEVRVLQFINGRLPVRTPRVLHHAPFSDTVLEPWDYGKKGVWYFFMDECQGVPLDTVIEGMSSTQLDLIADQLLAILNEMRSLTSTTLGSVTGGPYNNRFMPYPWHPPNAFSSTQEYLNYYRGIFLEFCGAEYVDELFSCFPTEAQVHFAHGDLLPHNIFVDGSRITAIIDWETAGYYPEFWEYCRMHEPGWMTPQWAHVLARVFPGPRREKEIEAVYNILRLLHYNSVFLV